MLNSEFLNKYIDLLIKYKIYPFAPLEINFMINFFWMLFRSFKKPMSSSTHPSGQGSYVQFKIITFIFSFLVLFMVYLSLEFWSSFNAVLQSFALILPSTVSIIISEISGLISKIVYQEETFITIEEKEMKLTSLKLSYYIGISFFVLFVFWAYMLGQHFFKI